MAVKAFSLALLLWLMARAAGSQPLAPVDSAYEVGPEGFVLVEAEDLPHSPKWQLVTGAAKGFTGRGFLRWTGGTQGSGHGQETDTTGRLQGRPADWLVVPVRIGQPGVYRVDLRNRHDQKDGDNDVWVHIAGFPPPVRRMGDHGVQTYQWLTWGPDYVTFRISEPGVYSFYLAGRSNGFGVDRIAVFGENAPARFRFAQTPVTPKRKATPGALQPLSR